MGGARERLDGGAQLGFVRSLTAETMDTLGEERLGKVAGLGLGVLTQGQGDGAAVGRIGKRADRLGQTGQQLLWPRDPVPVPRDRAKAVVRGNRGVAEGLDLLKHRVGAPVGEHVPGQQQDGQAIDMGHRRGGHQVRRARPDRGRAGHQPPPVVRLGEGDRRMGHRLFIVRAIGRQGLATLVERFAEAGDVGVTEDRPDAGDQRPDLAVQVHLLGAKVSDQALGHGEARDRHRHGHAAVPDAPAQPPVPPGGRIIGAIRAGAARIAPWNRSWHSSG